VIRRTNVKRIHSRETGRIRSDIVERVRAADLIPFAQRNVAPGGWSAPTPGSVHGVAAGRAPTRGRRRAAVRDQGARADPAGAPHPSLLKRQVLGTHQAGGDL
jgi:hypothetical protein